MKEILDYIFQYGIGTICVAYLIYFQSTTMKEILNTLGSMDKRLALIESHQNKEKGSE